MSQQSGKKIGSYQSIIRGVSQQPPHLRFEGQHWEQINVNSDPVKGLGTRKGLLVRNALTMTGFEALPDYHVNELKLYRSLKVKLNGNEYMILYRTDTSALPPGGSMIAPYFCWNITNMSYVPVFDDASYGAPNVIQSSHYVNGFTTMAQAGQFVVGAARGLGPGYTTTPKHGITSNRNQACIWIKGGAYKRTYTVRYKLLDTVGGTTYTVYTLKLQTPSATYPTAINIPAGSTADQIAKITAEYNSAANIYLGQAAAAIQPEQIAADIRTGLIGAGTNPQDIPAASITVDGANIFINFDRLWEMEIDDGGDGSLAVCASVFAQSTDGLTDQHFIDHVIKIQPKKSDGSDGYYLQATRKDVGGAGPTGPVVWKECAGIVTTLDTAMAFGVIGPYGVGGSEAFVLSTNIADLNTRLGTNFPVIAPSACGDVDTNPVPYFATAKKEITYLGMFQDRFVIGCGSILNISRTGDYFNWFRTSVLTLEDTDNIEMTSNDTDDDIIRHGVLFDRSLYLIGDKRQYSVSGRSVLTPTSQNIAVVGGFQNHSIIPPINTTNNVFFMRVDEVNQANELYQMQYGQVADVTEAYSVSPQLDDYLSLRVIDMVPINKPQVIFARCGDGRTMYNYRFVDAQGSGERLQSAWDKYQFALGYDNMHFVWGMQSREGLPVFIILMKGTDTGLWTQYMCVLNPKLTNSLNDGVYMDFSQTYIPGDTTPTFFSQNPTYANTFMWIQAIDGPYKGLSLQYADRAVFDGPEFVGTNFVIGVPFLNYVTLTNPYPKNYDGSVSTHGTTTVSRMEGTFEYTPALQVDVNTELNSWTTLNFNGYLTMAPADPITGWREYIGQLPWEVNVDNRQGAVSIIGKPCTPWRMTALNYDTQNYPR